jgi:hypothetical protein
MEHPNYDFKFRYGFDACKRRRSYVLALNKPAPHGRRSFFTRDELLPCEGSTALSRE